MALMLFLTVGHRGIGRIGIGLLWMDLYRVYVVMGEVDVWR